MKRLFKITGLTILLLFAFLTACVVFDPYMAWFRIVPRAKLTVDGKQERGWVHRGNQGKAFFVTHGAGDQMESYSVVFPEKGRGHIWKCGDWTAPYFPVFAIGDLNPPCWNVVIDDGTLPKSDPPKRDLVVGDNFLEFTLNDGRRLRAAW